MGITNPTALLGKADLVSNWECQVVCCSETSHTRRAVHALLPEFKKVGFHLSLSDPVPDKFQVQNPQGSFRGLSRGVALASLFPVFTPRPPFVPEVIWASQRILYSVFQVGQLPVHVVTLYLYPNAPLSSDKYRLNCKLVYWATQIVQSINGLAFIAGDFNIHWKKFDDLLDLSYKGWMDTQEAYSIQSGTPLEPTCKEATRHTFLLCCPGLYPYMCTADVAFKFDLDSHAVLRVSFDLPSYNPKVFNWLLPRSFDQCLVDTVSLRDYVVPQQEVQAFEETLNVGDTTETFRKWSQLAENSLLKYASLPCGGALPEARFRGRGALTAPVQRKLSASRFRFGRSTDFLVSHPSSKIQVRQVQKQARRLQSLTRLFARKQGCSIVEVNQLWSAILAATGFGRSFVTWVRRNSTLDCTFLCPKLAGDLFQLVSRHATNIAAQAWKSRQAEFVHAVEDSWSANGGKLPFRLVREQPLPPVLDLQVRCEVMLAPQKWSPYGLEWIKLRNPGDFQIGNILTSGHQTVEVVAVAPDAIQVSARLTRREASQLHRVYITADPAEWVPHFLAQWEKFWKTDSPVDVESLGPTFEALPSFTEVQLPPLQWDDWSLALESAKKQTMRGVDGWSVKELSWLPFSVIQLLFQVFDQVMSSRKWPVQLTTWLLVLLRKTPEQSPDWSLLRPISVAGLVYRIWSRIQTRRLMVHARSLSSLLASPALSTKAIWTFISDLVSHRQSVGQPLCGLVLDIVKCFNVLDRRLLKALFDRFGFDRQITALWMDALAGLSRAVLIGGYAYGESFSNSGIPEGDPLSVVGMFVFAFAFSRFVDHHVPQALIATYADNWEIWADSTGILQQALPVVEQFLEQFHLPVAVKKCWSWAIRPLDRRLLRAQKFFGASLPLKLAARELGADVSYCRKRAAKVRNLRVSSGHQRLLKLSGLPVPIWRKTRLLLSSIFKVSKGLGLALKGSSPYLACLLGTYQCVDPEFVLMVNRLRSFRQVVRELPELHAFFMRQLVSTNRAGPTEMLVRSLDALGWTLVNQDGIFQDEFGRLFHLCLSPLAHVCSLLLSSWCDQVAARVKHRLYLTQLTNIDMQLSRQVKHLLPGERALLRGQQSGAFFSGEYMRHAVGQDHIPCRFCGSPDSRLHRLRDCPKVDAWRGMFPKLKQQWESLPEFTTVFGLWEEPRQLRAWQGLLDSVPFPAIDRQCVQEPAVLYSDGSCLNPGLGYLRLAAAAVIHALPDGRFSVCWRGRVPLSHQTPFRSELLAGAVALRSFDRVTLFSDCRAFVLVAQRLIQAKRQGKALSPPRENLDLWAYFLESLDGLDVSNSEVCWIKGHGPYQSQTGLAKVHAWFNHWADRVANTTVLQVASHPLFQDLCTSYKTSAVLARDLASYQAGVGMIFAGEHDAPTPVTVPCFVDVKPLGQASSVTVTVEVIPPAPRPDFASLLVRWLCGLSFVAQVDFVPIGVLGDMSWVELFWVFLHTTGVVPPFRFNGKWVCLQDDVSFVFVLPPFLELFRSWKRHLDVLLCSTLVVPWVKCVPRVGSLGLLGARFHAAGFVGRFQVSLECAQEFATQLCAAPRVSALKLPASVN